MQWTGNPRVHLAFEILGYLAGLSVYVLSRMRRGDVVPDRDRATVLTGAALGAGIGARLLFMLSFPGADFFGGKTVVGGLLGGLIGVELAKKWKGIPTSTGDLFVYPLMTAMAIGRIGCFLAGPIDKTAGLPTSLPWGIAIADGVRRHPVALYEIAFLIVLAIGLTHISQTLSGKAGTLLHREPFSAAVFSGGEGADRRMRGRFTRTFIRTCDRASSWLQRKRPPHPAPPPSPPAKNRGGRRTLDERTWQWTQEHPDKRLRADVLRNGDRFRIFLASYLLFRFAVDFLKPDPPPFALGLSAIQWACLAGLLYYALVLTNADRNASLPFLRRRRLHLHDVLSQD
jgi:prolipoprotein diacylglyceryltransferase